ncbi:tetratricopeptide repeat protein, partial [Streptomyces sp. NPDC006446]|uniref:tetratricopeptide repeat protein n=1 Tax=Streptomyces sp. NPDC006446 TaxID=3154301 RepID=UPI0033BA58B9
MAEQPISRQEMIRRRRRNGFVGRRSELEAFRENLCRVPDSDAYQFMFYVHGHAGVGKTSLTRQWESIAREYHAVTAFVGDEVHSVLEAMESISHQLGNQGCALKAFDKSLANYRQRRYEAETASTLSAANANASAEPPPPNGASGPSTAAARAGLVGLSLIPGAGPFVGALDAQHIATGADRLYALAAARLRNHDDVQLVTAPEKILTPKFVTEISEIAARRPWVILFFDTYEQTAPWLDHWLGDLLFTDAHGHLPITVQVVLSGQGQLQTRCWGDKLDMIAQMTLDVFSEEEARSLMASKGVTDEDAVKAVLRLSRRMPLLVDVLAQTRPDGPNGVGDPSDTAVERFLKWEADPERRATALDCALPLHLNQDIYRALVHDTVTDHYTWLRSLPFVTEQGGHWRYHDVVRIPMLRLQRLQSPQTWSQKHLRLADAFRTWRQASESSPVQGRHRTDPTWHEYRLNEIYHRLCASPVAFLPQALHEVVHACDQGLPALRRWAHMLTQAGYDAADETLEDLGRRLQNIADNDAVTTTSALEMLLTRRELSPDGQALAYAVRGRAHHETDRFRDAVADYTMAIRLSPGMARSYAGRGAAYRRLGRYADALADYTRAVELDQNLDWATAGRGVTHQLMGRYDEALADYDRAIELNPNLDWAIARRGNTHQLI